VATPRKFEDTYREGPLHLDKVIFGRPRKCHSSCDASDAIEEYLAALMKNGQIGAEYFMADKALPIVAYVDVPAADALDAKYTSSWGIKALNEIVRIYGKFPKVEMQERPKKAHLSSWRSAKFLYLYTHLFDRGSPVYANGLDYAIPAYLLPLKETQREYLVHWAISYRNHDRIWIGSGALEVQAYKQLADPASELSKEGREHCAEIEAITNKPTYYYLLRYHGRQRREDQRRCPLCGKPWAVTKGIGKSSRFDRFDFQCDRCRLISHQASDCNERLAHIGEYKRSR
jgi:predicted  nucleic acid-binding Zn ribbon protein